MITCQRCGIELKQLPEYEKGDWFVRCLECGVKNLIAPGARIIGWRT